MIRSGCVRSASSLAITHLFDPPRQLRLQFVSDTRSSSRSTIAGVTQCRASGAWQVGQSRDWAVQIRAFAVEADQVAAAAPAAAASNPPLASHLPVAFNYHQLYSQVSSLLPVGKTDPLAAMGEAEKLIRQTRSQNVKLDLANYAALIQLFDECGDIDRGICAVALSSADALALIDELEDRELKPHPRVLASLLSTFVLENNREGYRRASKLSAQLGLMTHSVDVLNICISGAIQFQDPYVGLYLFDKGQDSHKLRPNQDTLRGLLTVCSMMDLPRRALKMVEEFKRKWDVKADSEMYAQLLRLVLKDNWPEGFFKTEASFWSSEVKPNRDIWNLLILGNGSHGSIDTAMSMLDEMRTQGVRPDQMTLACLLKACARIQDFDNALQACRQVHRDGVEIEANSCGVLLKLAEGTKNKDKFEEAVRMTTECAADNELLTQQIALLRKKLDSGKTEAKVV